MGPEVEVGFFGKLPALGDFVARRVPDRLVDTWDRWLQGALLASRERLGEQWLDAYLTAPMWRFWAQGGLLDDAPYAGILFPSVDRVGRSYPFTVFARLPPTAVGLVVAVRCTDWFERVEDLVLAQFDEEGRSLEEFEANLLALAPRLVAGLQTVSFPHAATAFPAALEPSSGHWHVPLGGRVEVAPAALAWLDRIIDRSVAAPVYWWTSGSARVRPSWLITRGLPEPQAFGALLSGAWHDWPWASCELPEAGEPSGSASFHLESAGSTHRGNVRTQNQDAYVCRPEIGLWAVADGMGGHDQGHVASQMASDALAAVPNQAGLVQLMHAARHALVEVNEYLFGLSLRPVNPLLSGTTVVVLLVRGQSGVALWAGDSRLYRLRDGRLEQLTVDHAEQESAGGPGLPGSNVITRAVGGKQELELDHVSFDVRLGDRFLLCSDGLYRELGERELCGLLESGDAITTVTALERRVLQGQAADNVTVVVVDVQPGAD